ncbi:Glycine betaine/L-proline transport system permease protein ProW [Sporotomaculum syntrophicum]|uniref:Glycine betaine/L-proline transport system permease protein ProW n=1 Tax=Sporotomaculum syntrophicum TaxID=182264 RepID=A0A9D2WPA6_9FIRM|nr:proline/glycine betaine ABC transporter permease [Sporotomaculum syntrophicum]KAF1084421.1 Glycine betaine/L-proline transport system permease protein ProW [Sporotomaculum syntrophicum]
MIDFVIPLADWINAIFEVVSFYLSPVLRSSSVLMESIIKQFENILIWPPEVVVMIIVGAIVWKLTNYRLAIFAVFGFLISYGIGVWEETMATIALALSGTAVSLLLGIPLGIIASQSNFAERIIRPVLDFMQTLPSFVYLIPAVMFFGMGKVAALVATMIFAMPPAVRLTNLGIREVSKEMVEAAQAFGSSRWQTLVDIQLPLALPTIMAGVNQCIMMALAMTVIASMIGAGGLGMVVLRSMQTLDIGMGAVGGLSIVILAILLDRITENITKKQKEQKNTR